MIVIFKGKGNRLGILNGNTHLVGESEVFIGAVRGQLDLVIDFVWRVESGFLHRYVVKVFMLEGKRLVRRQNERPLCRVDISSQNERKFRSAGASEGVERILVVPVPVDKKPIGGFVIGDFVADEPCAERHFNVEGVVHVIEIIRKRKRVGKLVFQLFVIGELLVGQLREGNLQLIVFSSIYRDRFIVALGRIARIILAIDYDTDVGAERCNVRHVKAVLEYDRQSGAVAELKC